MIKYIFLYCLILPFSHTLSDLSVSDLDVDSTIDFNELIAESDLVVLVEAMNSESIKKGRIIDQYQYFKTVEVLTGTSEPIIQMKINSLFQGDIVHQMTADRSFEEGEIYLLFLDENDEGYEFSNDAILKETTYEGQSYFTNHSMDLTHKQTVDKKNNYDKNALIEAIKSFHYNEIEIIDSEVTVE